MTMQIKLIVNEIIAATPQDPLIALGDEQIIKICVLVILVAITITIGIISPRLEHAIIFAVFTSLITITFFVIN